MLAHMSVANGEAIVPQIPSQLLALEAVRATESPPGAPLLPPTDHPRKRCSSDIEEHRGPKALKREQQDDAPLSVIFHEESLHQPTLNSLYAASSTFPGMHAFPVGPASQPPSRAPSPPPIFHNPNQFKPFGATGFAPLTTGGTPLPVLPGSNNSPSYPTLPHAPWSEPVLMTSRRQHSLSLGSANGPLVQPTTPSNSGLRNAVSSGLQSSNVLTNSSSTISPPIGRMSRSGSISGTPFKFAKPTLPDPHTDTGIWHKSKKPATRNGQTSFYFSSEPVHSRTFAGNPFNHTSSEPATAHNSPSDEEADDDDDDDSEEEYGPSEITSSTQVKYLLIFLPLTNLMVAGPWFGVCGHRYASRIPT
jgi:hypothetical protein